MPPTYLFARYLPADWRAAILQAHYRPSVGSPQLLADGTYCPLGVPHRDGLVEWFTQPSAPSGEAVALELSRRRPLTPEEWMDDAEYEAVIASVNAFTDDWDAGRIGPADLPRIFALGVPT